MIGLFTTTNGEFNVVMLILVLAAAIGLISLVAKLISLTPQIQQWRTIQRISLQASGVAFQVGLPIKRLRFKPTRRIRNLTEASFIFGGIALVIGIAGMLLQPSIENLGFIGLILNLIFAYPGCTLTLSGVLFLYGCIGLLVDGVISLVPMRNNPDKVVLGLTVVIACLVTFTIMPWFDNWMRTRIHVEEVFGTLSEDIRNVMIYILSVPTVAFALRQWANLVMPINPSVLGIGIAIATAPLYVFMGLVICFCLSYTLVGCIVICIITYFLMNTLFVVNEVYKTETKHLEVQFIANGPSKMSQSDLEKLYFAAVCGDTKSEAVRLWMMSGAKGLKSKS